MEEYEGTTEGACPVCGSDLDYGSFYPAVDGESGYWDVWCLECEATGREWHKMQYIETVMEE